ncbi:hypothetical protein KGEDBEEJ_04295 [Aeromonas hydrophila]
MGRSVGSGLGAHAMLFGDCAKMGLAVAMRVTWPCFVAGFTVSGAGMGQDRPPVSFMSRAVSCPYPPVLPCLPPWSPPA